MSPNLNTDLGRLWLAGTLTMLSKHATEHGQDAWLSIDKQMVSVGVGPPPGPPVSGIIFVTPNLTTTELLLLAQKIGTLVSTPHQEHEFTTYPKGHVPLNLEEQVLVKVGQKISAIKALRMRVTNSLTAAGYKDAQGHSWYGLKDAKDSVDAWAAGSLWHYEEDVTTDPVVQAVLKKHSIVLPNKKAPPLADYEGHP